MIFSRYFLIQFLTVTTPLLAFAFDTQKCDPIFIYSYLTQLHNLGWKSSQEVGEREKWGIDGPSGARVEYEYSFSKLFIKLNIKSNGYFNKLFISRQQNNLETNVLDLFGSGFFVDNPRLVTSITGMRLGPFMYEYGYGAQEADRPEIIGDIFNDKTWQDLDASMKERGIKSLDLVTMRPVGAWLYLFFKGDEQKILGLSYIVENVSKRLSDDGVFYFKIADTLSRKGFVDLKKRLEQISNRKVTLVTDEQISGAITPR